MPASRQKVVSGGAGDMVCWFGCLLLAVWLAVPVADDDLLERTTARHTDRAKIQFLFKERAHAGIPTHSGPLGDFESNR